MKAINCLHISIIAIIAVLFAPFVQAELYFANATVTLHIINQHPRINELELSPSNPYTDSTITCNVDFFDEDKEHAALSYTWRINGKVIDGNGEILQNAFEPNDKIDCIVTAVDSAGLASRPGTGSVIIQDSDASTKIVRTALGLIGVKADTEKTLELQQDGIASITGYAVSEIRGQGLASAYILLLVLALLILVNVNIFLRLFQKRKSKSVTQ